MKDLIFYITISILAFMLLGCEAKNNQGTEFLQEEQLNVEVTEEVEPEVEIETESETEHAVDTENEEKTESEIEFNGAHYNGVILVFVT